MIEDMPEDFAPQVRMIHDERGLVIVLINKMPSGRKTSIGYAVKPDDPLSELPEKFRMLKQSLWIALHSEKAA